MLTLMTFDRSLRPHEQSPTRLVNPDDILSLPGRDMNGEDRPCTSSTSRLTSTTRSDYAIDGVPKRKGSSTEIEVKSEEDILKMRRAGRAAREVLDIAGRLVAPGIATDAIDAAVHEATIERKAYPSPLNYRNFPKSCCTSVNEVRRRDATCFIGTQLDFCSIVVFRSFVTEFQTRDRSRRGT